jgi:hypothetical protein
MTIDDLAAAIDRYHVERAAERSRAVRLGIGPPLHLDGPGALARRKALAEFLRVQLARLASIDGR